ncbi:GNAT family N-acetyltransferase [Flagellimonas aequoris]|nr:GNAT family N-acetyltransferase [Allomuricauda aequoris]
MLQFFKILGNQLDFHEFMLLYDRAGTVYKSLSNTYTGCDIFPEESSSTIPYPIHIKPLIITSVPGYLETVPVFGSRTTLKKVKTYPGSLIKLSSYPNFEAYLDQNFNKKRQANFLRSEETLYDCFDIEHRVFYGEMEKSDYETVFKAFQEMQSFRFDQLGTQDDAADMWPIYYKQTLELVQNKKACISVIYDGDNPIAISLNYVLGKMMFGFTKTFDMAYTKFGIGNVELLKMISWCIDEGFEVLDFMKGEYDYKNRFIDHAYPFSLQIMYSRNTLKQRLWGTTAFWVLQFFYFIYHGAKWLGLRRSRNRQTFLHNRSASTPMVDQIPLHDQSSIETGEFKVSLNEVRNKYLQKAVCDYCYLHRKPLKSISIYAKKEDESYIKMIAPSESFLFTFVQPKAPSSIK